MKTKQVIMASLICILSAAAIVTAILGQGEIQIVQADQNYNQIEINNTPEVIEPTSTVNTDQEISTSSDTLLEESTTTQNETNYASTTGE